MKTYELLRENEWTVDGRYLDGNAVSWEDGNVPLIDFDGNVIGQVKDIRRYGNSILGDIDVVLPDSVALTCDLRLDVLTHTDEGDVVGHVALLLAAHTNDKSNYPWPEKKEGDADGR